MEEKPDFVGHQKFDLAVALKNDLPINNVIIDGPPEDPWIGETTLLIGDWRARFRSTYLQWALTINGLHVAREKYQRRRFQREKGTFYVESLRELGRVRLAEWSWEEAEKNSSATIPMIAAWGLVDLYSNFEEFVFCLYRIFLNHRPDSLLQDKFKPLRQLREAAVNSEADRQAWEAAWKARLEQWQRGKIYEGLGKVFLGYMTLAELKAPSHFENTGPTEWAESLAGVALVRNSFTHGQQTVTKELAEFCSKPHGLAFDFKEGEPLKVTLAHLMGVEAFADALLTALNLSLLQRAGMPMPGKK